MLIGTVDSCQKKFRYTEVNKIMKTLKKIEEYILFALSTLKELHLATLNVLLSFAFVYILWCSCQCINEICLILKEDRSLVRV
jgi:hypothetical protein